jgi:hypothetical protein
MMKAAAISAIGPAVQTVGITEGYRPSRTLMSAR